MKTPIAVTLIIVGGLLIMTPALADFLYQRNVVALLATANFDRVMLAGQMSELYRFGCWLNGSGMVGVAVLSSMFRSGQKNEQGNLARQPA
jgi:hypothetical protein